jgi:hypothetical protein
LAECCHSGNWETPASGKNPFNAGSVEKLTRIVANDGAVNANTSMLTALKSFFDGGSVG